MIKSPELAALSGSTNNKMHSKERLCGLSSGVQYAEMFFIKVWHCFLGDTNAPRTAVGGHEHPFFILLPIAFQGMRVKGRWARKVATYKARFCSSINNFVEINGVLLCTCT